MHPDNNRKVSFYYEWKCKLFPNQAYYVGSEAPEWHHRQYLRTPDDPGIPYSNLHKAMRKYGIDWFSAIPARSNRKRPRPHIRPGKRGKPTWNTGLKTGQYHWRGKSGAPRVGQWKISTALEFLVVTNLSEWCRQRGYKYRTIKNKIRFNSFPYKDIEEITRWRTK